MSEILPEDDIVDVNPDAIKHVLDQDTHSLSNVGSTPHDYGVGLRVEYINTTDNTIYISLRNGITFPVLPRISTTCPKNSVTVRTSYEVGGRVADAFLDSLEGLIDDQENLEEIHAVKESFVGSRLAPASTIRRSHVEHVFTQKHIMQTGGTIYNSELDIVISFYPKESTPPHPRSVKGRSEALLRQDEHLNDRNWFGVKITIVDNMHMHGRCKYINVQNKVFRVPIIQSSDLKDGVHILTSGELPNGRKRAEPETLHFDLDVCMENDNPSGFRLWNSFNDAKYYGDAESARERDIKEAERKLKEEKIERDRLYEKEKHEMNKRKMELEEEHQKRQFKLDERQAELEEERKRLENLRKIEEIERKANQDQQKDERNTVIEIFKFGTALLTGILAGVAVVKKAS